MERPQYEEMYEREDWYWWFVGKRRLVSSLIDTWTRLESNSRILDVGCGTGTNLKHLAQWGDGTGVDYSPIALDLARTRGLPQLTQASAMALPFADETFSLVTALDVFYHRWVVDDHRALGECFRVLRPGGWLLLSEPASPRLWGGHDEVFYARERYTLWELSQKVQDAHFSIRKLSYSNTLLFPIFAVSRWLASRSASASDGELPSLPTWLNQILLGVLTVEAMWLRWGNLPIGSSVICLAQKPD
jgi:SAM-dependent methyltransferase